MASGINRDLTMKKVLIIHHGSGLGGGLIALIGLIRELKEQYHVSVLCIFKSDAIDYLKREGIEVLTPKNNFFYSRYNLYIHSEASYNNPLSAFKFFYFFLLNLLNMFYFSKKEFEIYAGKFDILYLNSLFLSDWLIHSRSFFSRVIVHDREPLAKGIMGIRKTLFRIVLNKYADVIFCVSEDNKRRINLPHKTFRVYDPVVSANRMQNKYPRTDKFKYFVYLGGSQRIKGFEQLVNSLEFLDSDIKIFFLGGIEELLENNNTLFFKIRKIFSPYLKNNLPLLKLKLEKSARIEFIGKTDEVFDYYSQSIAVICPFSKPHAALPILEAYSVGKPVIVSDIEGMDELYKKEIMYIFRNGDFIDLATKINSLSKYSDCDLSRIKLTALEKFKQIYVSNPNICDLIS